MPAAGKVGLVLKTYGVAGIAAVILYIAVLATTGRWVRNRVTNSTQVNKFVPILSAGSTNGREYFEFEETSFAAHPGRLSIRPRAGGKLVSLGAPVQTSANGLVRRFVEHGVTKDLRQDKGGRLMGHLGETPTDFGLPFETVHLGHQPAWKIPAESKSASGVWVIHVHGLGSSRSQVLRGVSTFERFGFTSLIPSYRTSLDTTGTSVPASHLGVTEWRDINRAQEYALASGATRIIYVGWSLGASIVLRTIEQRPVAEVVGVLLVSPALDWHAIILAGLVHAGTPRLLARWMISGFNLARLPGEPYISWKGMPGILTRKNPKLAIMVFHGTADRSVLVQYSQDYAATRESFVSFVEFRGAHHTLEWNSSPQLWEEAVTSWCHSLGLVDRDDNPVRTLEAK